MGRRLNTSTPTVIQTELVPLDENFAIEANGTLEQWYYENNSQYAPDRSITPLILSPKIMVADKDSQQSWDDAHVTKSVVAWSVMESNTWVDITSSSVLSDYELSGNNLIVHKNVSYSQGVTIMCKLTYVDPRDNGIYITTQDTVLLTCNRDANVVLPEVAITSPSARSFNPLVDGASTEYDFDAVVTNSPDVEMQSSDIATYKIDGGGTEEIISDANGIVPILDIRYPDSETQTDQEFVYRQTANGEKTDETGAAFISKIKGNTVAWNQLCKEKGEQVSVFGAYFGTTIPQGHKIYLSSKVKKSTDFTSSDQRIYLAQGANTYGSGISYTSVPTDNNYHTQKDIVDNLNSANCNLYYFQTNKTGTVTFKESMVIDLTLIYGAGNEPETVEEFESDYERWFGKPLTYEEYDAGSLRPVLMQSVKTTGFNQWDEEWEAGTIAGTSGQNADSGNAIRSKNYIKVFPNTQYYAQSYVVVFFYKQDRSFISFVSYGGIITTPSDCYYMRFATAGTYNYGTTYNHDICINISDPSKNGTYEPYDGHIASVPVTSATGRLLDANGNPTGSTVTIFPDGLKKAGNVQDEIFVENGVVKAIKRVGSVDLGTLTWLLDNNYNFFYVDLVGTSVSVNTSRVDIVLPSLCSLYTNAGIIAAAEDSAFAGLSKNKVYTIHKFSTSSLHHPYIYIKDSSYNDATTFGTAMNGVMLYYELETPETYVLDPVQNPFIYKWFGIDANNNEVLAETQPWYVSGQDTSKLRVDAMWGEKINVVLRAMMPTGALSPSKAYAALTWRIPDVDTTVVSYNGSAVRSDTNSMTFGTIVNINGRNLEDSVKAANLRFKWVYRKNFTSQETVAGWSQGESDQITIQASNLRSVRAQDSTLASTLVFPYVYCLGAWTTNQGTETGYSKPTTTKNGVTYYRIVD